MKKNLTSKVMAAEYATKPLFIIKCALDTSFISKLFITTFISEICISIFLEAFYLIAII